MSHNNDEHFCGFSGAQVSAQRTGANLGHNVGAIESKSI